MNAADPLAIWIAYNDASNEGDHERAGRFVSPTLRVLVNGTEAVASVDEDRAVQQELIACYPDYRRDFDGGFAYGETAVVEWTMYGTAKAETRLPRLHVPGCSVIRCDGERIVEARLYHPTGCLDLVVERALGPR